jgi:uroporphyrinogen-III synthase
MTGRLHNKRIAITEWRQASELASLLERQGAMVFSCPLVEQRPPDDRKELVEFIERMIRGEIDLMIFLTGIGARTLVETAGAVGKKDDFLRALEQVRVVVRGPKPLAVLRALGVRVDIVPKEPTTHGVLAALGAERLAGTTVGVQLYGVPNPLLRQELERRGATVVEVLPYDYRLASPEAEVVDFIGRILDGEFDAVAFTSAPQVTMLFAVAERHGVAEMLRRSLNEEVPVAVIGPVAEKALADAGVTARIKPTHFVMGFLVKAMGDYFAAQEGP